MVNVKVEIEGKVAVSGNSYHLYIPKKWIDTGALKVGKKYTFVLDESQLMPEGSSPTGSDEEKRALRHLYAQPWHVAAVA